ncbi:ABC transporter ATP-binding protein [Flavisolibacter tropicus]|uniref:ABC transporter ATP-binding protein n=1 Tax=Flavisolibacter tropicus TaxID=1492898 RepID=UPI0009EF02E2|nr:ATP-binding cassette domain-containing protein [Flavisolibacter tropicus]
MIEVRNLRKGFENKTVLNGVDAAMQTGKCNLIIGSSGSGKTVLMKCIVGLFQPDEGDVMYDGQNFTKMTVEEKKEIRKQIGMLFQGSALFSSMTVEENIIFPLDMFTKQTRKEKLNRVNEVLERVNLEGANKKFPAELSGGMMKRVGIARAIVLNPKYLFVDEPNSGLDPQTSGLIDKLIQEITEEYNITTVINTHDMNSVMEIGDNIIYMYQGEKEWEGNSKDIIFSKNERLNDFIFASKFLKDAKDMRMLEETGMVPENRDIEEIINNAEEPLIPPSDNEETPNPPVQ